MKKFSFATKMISLLLAGSIFLTSCSSTTLIQSYPSGAKVYINGDPVGTTPYTYRDTKIVGSTNTVRLEKEGYDSFSTTFSRDEEVDIIAVVGGIFLLAPFLWTLKYKPNHSYELIPNAKNDRSMQSIISQENQFKSKAERLSDLKQLLDNNVISKLEYEKEKAKILEEDEK
jgi:PEGA domain